MKTLIVIGGPTASGKTALATELAQALHTCIISADSRQCYTEMTIGVAKPSADELSIIPHYFINSHSIHDNVSTGIFEKYALDSLEKIFQQSDYAICVGGTGLYIKALCEGLDEMPAIDTNVLKEVELNYTLNGLKWLQQRVLETNALGSDHKEFDNPARLMRALIFKLSTGMSVQQFKKGAKKERPFSIQSFAIACDRVALYKNIEVRVDTMMKNGLLQEAETLFTNRHLKCTNTVGYTELFDVIKGDCRLDTAVEKIKQHTRNYAKRQITWFRNQGEYVWLRKEEIINEIYKTGIAQ